MNNQTTESNTSIVFPRLHTGLTQLFGDVDAQVILMTYIQGLIKTNPLDLAFVIKSVVADVDDLTVSLFISNYTDAINNLKREIEIIQSRNIIFSWQLNKCMLDINRRISL